MSEAPPVSEPTKIRPLEQHVLIEIRKIDGVPFQSITEGPGPWRRIIGQWNLADDQRRNWSSEQQYARFYEVRSTTDPRVVAMLADPDAVTVHPNYLAAEAKKEPADA